jgi:hypothetical protein
MAAGIQEGDRGVVWGDTWHKHPVYIRKQSPVTYEEAVKVFDFPIDKIPNNIVTPEGFQKVDNSYTLVRTDIWKPLLSKSVGSDFTVETFC